jgi:hypothetical protein
VIAATTIGADHSWYHGAPTGDSEARGRLEREPGDRKHVHQHARAWKNALPASGLAAVIARVSAREA